jgi:hypothetical protein
MAVAITVEANAGKQATILIKCTQRYLEDKAETL